MTRMLTRKQFIGSLLGMAGFAALAACSSSDGDDTGTPQPDASVPPPDGAVTPTPDAPPAATCGTPSAVIGSNHGHTLTVAQADVDAGVEKTYSIQGSSAHPHTVTITAQMFATLKSTRTLQTTSSNDASHTHSVTVTC